MSVTLTLHQPPNTRPKACEDVLRALPQWFGLEPSLLEYVEAIGKLPTILAVDEDEQVVGFLTLERHFPTAAEIHVMAIHPERHRQGLGRRLVSRAEQTLRGQGVRFLQVKTLSATSPDLYYARTREFYLSQGFTPLEEMSTLWSEHNPCLVCIKHLESS